MGNFLKFAALCDLQNIVAAVVQVIARAPHRGKRGITGGDSRKRHRFLRAESGFRLVHARLPGCSVVMPVGRYIGNAKLRSWAHRRLVASLPDRRASFTSR